MGTDSRAYHFCLHTGGQLIIAAECCITTMRADDRIIFDYVYPFISGTQILICPQSSRLACTDRLRFKLCLTDRADVFFIKQYISFFYYRSICILFDFFRIRLLI